VVQQLMTLWVISPKFVIFLFAIMLLFLSLCNVYWQDRIAQQRYKDMKTSENQFFTLHHCWKILEHNQKWKLRDQEAPPPRTGAPIPFDDDSDHAPTGGRNKGSPESRRKKLSKVRGQKKGGAREANLKH
jgi:hypothetical protein